MPLLIYQKRFSVNPNLNVFEVANEIIGQQPLERCEGCGQMAATSKFLSRVEKRTPQGHPDKEDHHHYCPSCTKRFSMRLRRLSL